MPAILLIIAILLLPACTTLATGDAQPAPPPRLTGAPTPIHDPTIIKAPDGFYYVVNTGFGVPIWRSRDLQTWRKVGRAFETDVPQWTAELFPDARDIWAPDIARVGDRYVLTYSVSKFHTNTSAIGLAVSDSLDPKTANWQDRGPVIRSAKGDRFNAIDPQVLQTRDGRVFIAFGSMWDGLFLQQLDPKSLRPLSEERTRLAARPAGDTIEAPYLIERDGYWYLFVSFDACCRGVRSTYNIRVGRSERIRGPYLDRDGVPMLEGGGTPLLSSIDNEAGTGHCSVIRDNDRWLLAYHYYDHLAAGRPTFGLRELRWDTQGWPIPTDQLIKPTSTILYEPETQVR